MIAFVFTNRSPRSGGGSHAIGRGLREKAEYIGAVAGLAGGVLAGILGSLLTGASWVVTDAGARHLLAVMGTTLLFLTIPLIIFGACCMDWVDKGKSSRHSNVASYEEEEEERFQRGLARTSMTAEDHRRETSEKQNEGD